MNGWGDTMGEAKIKVSSAVDVIFADLEKYHGAKYVVEKLGNFDEESAMQVKADWANEVIRLPKNLVADGLRRARKSQWCPTLAQFVAMCLPTPEQAFHEAVRGAIERSHGRNFSYTCPAVYFAGTFFDGDLRTGDWKQSQSKWSKVWDEEVARQGKGLLGDVPQVQARLESEAPTEYVKPDPAKVQAFRDAKDASKGFTRMSEPLGWAYRLKSISAAKMLLSNYAKLDLKNTLAQAVEHHIKNTRKIVRNVDGVLCVGDAQLFARS